MSSIGKWKYQKKNCLMTSCGNQKCTASNWSRRILIKLGQWKSRLSSWISLRLLFIFCKILVNILVTLRTVYEITHCFGSAIHPLYLKYRANKKLAIFNDCVHCVQRQVFSFPVRTNIAHQIIHFAAVIKLIFDKKRTFPSIANALKVINRSNTSLF